MSEKLAQKEIERRKANIREHIKGVKFHTLAPGVTTHPFIRGGKPCIEGRGIKAPTTLNYCAEHVDYMDGRNPHSSVYHEPMA